MTAFTVYLFHFASVKIRNQLLIQGFGLHIRSLRMAKGLSQEGLAGLAGIEKTQIVRIENGQVNTTISTIYALSQALDTSLQKLMAFNF